MTPDKIAEIRSRVQNAKDSADMTLASAAILDRNVHDPMARAGVSMLERNLRDLVKQLHQVHTILQGGK